MTTWVVLTGLPASGKSTLARKLASRVRAAILDKDRIREAIFPGALTDYTEEQDALCMRAILEAAAYLTAHAMADFIFFDGRTYSQQWQIEEVLRAAEQAGAQWRIIEVSCSEEVAEARLSHADPLNPARNRNLELYRRIRQHFEPIRFPKLEVDTSEGLDGKLERAEKYLRNVD